MPWHVHSTTERKKSNQELWVKCKKCHAHIFKDEWKNNLEVCPNCNYHGSISSTERIKLLIDKGTFKELFNEIIPQDSLKFNDLKGSYKDKIDESIKK